MIQVFIPQIKELMEVMVTVYNTHMGTNISPEVEVKVQESKLSYNSIDDKIKDYDWKVSNNYMTPAQVLVEISDDLDEDSAQELIDENKLVNEGKTVTPNEVNQESPILINEEMNTDNMPQTTNGTEPDTNV
jgi:hypothetical protein